MAKKAEQIAALPVTWDRKGRLRVLMVTTRETRRWIMPKGWEMDGKKRWEAAEIEALEEAGAVGYIGHRPIGRFKYQKRLGTGAHLKCTVRVYPMVVEKLKKNWKERKERKRRWFSAKAAAKRVQEKSLKKLLRALHKNPENLVALLEDYKAAG